VPVISVLSAMLFLGERVNAGQLAAGGVVILGVMVASGYGLDGIARQAKKYCRQRDKKT